METEHSWRAKQWSTLNPSAEGIRRWGTEAVEFVASYLGSIRERRLYPDRTSADIRAQIDRALPSEGTAFEQILDDFREVIVPLSRQNAHPRMFGYVQAPGNVVCAYADLLASTLNANLTAWRSAPAPVEIERLTIDWIKQIIGYAPDAAGLFVSGGSMANLSALAAARNRKAPASFAEKGAFAGTMRVYCSLETHHSIAKAAALLGIGRENVRQIAVDGNSCLRPEDLVASIRQDLAAGYVPCCIVANAGTVTTGAVDPLDQFGEIAQRFGLWLHVDACYGGFAALAPSTKSLFAGIAEADSVALDPHKWLYLPVDCGCILYRDADTARATFAHAAEYTRVLEQTADEAFAFWDYGPELSRRFRALKVWMLLRTVGIRVLGEAVEKDLACARHFETLVRASEDFEMLAPVQLSIFCFRYVPAHLRRMLENAGAAARAGVEKKIDRCNESLLVALQRDGSSYLSNAQICGRFSLRGCVMNYRTTLSDMEILLADLRRVAAQMEN